MPLLLSSWFPYFSINTRLWFFPYIYYPTYFPLFLMSLPSTYDLLSSFMTYRHTYKKIHTHRYAYIIYNYTYNFKFQLFI